MNCIYIDHILKVTSQVMSDFKKWKIELQLTILIYFKLSFIKKKKIIIFILRRSFKLPINYLINEQALILPKKYFDCLKFSHVYKFKIKTLFFNCIINYTKESVWKTTDVSQWAIYKQSIKKCRSISFIRSLIFLDP